MPVVSYWLVSCYRGWIVYSFEIIPFVFAHLLGLYIPDSAVVPGEEKKKKSPIVVLRRIRGIMYVY